MRSGGETATTKEIWPFEISFVERFKEDSINAYLPNNLVPQLFIYQQQGRRPSLLGNIDD
jgi:hypothetical protein